MGAIVILGDKDGQQQQNHHQHIRDIRIRVNEFLIDSHQDNRYDNSTHYPHKLLHRPGHETDRTGIIKAIPGTVYTQPATQHQQQVQSHCHPVNLRYQAIFLHLRNQ